MECQLKLTKSMEPAWCAWCQMEIEPGRTHLFCIQGERLCIHCYHELSDPRKSDRKDVRTILRLVS